MKKEEILKQLAERLDDLIKLKGIFEMLDGPAIKLGIERGFAILESKEPEIADEFLQTAEAFIYLDVETAIDEAADLVAEIVKMILFHKK